MQLFQTISLALAFLYNVEAYSTPQSSSQNKPMNRLTFLQKSITATTLATTAISTNINSAAYAKEIDPAVKGTKADPAYQACLSKCVFECTKPKGDEQKSRAECIPECKQKCATSKEQLMIGTPIQKS